MGRKRWEFLVIVFMALLISLADARKLGIPELEADHDHAVRVYGKNAFSPSPPNELAAVKLGGCDGSCGWAGVVADMGVEEEAEEVGLEVEEEANLASDSQTNKDASRTTETNALAGQRMNAKFDNNDNETGIRAMTPQRKQWSL
ncbi:hypothetical protein POM88_042746 [Heracleum sosnowskyi]|uniref:Uncharacterized protein n=1 Tax=Heracleum sosnowskyi TaxID=360622 RepID=A0AAD8M9H5_9APIA|nr:hypothetical protein POM88_042746 [Heracleum sosnowskyi]